MATKFGTKWAITRLISEISRRSLRIARGFWGHAIEWRQTNSTATNPRCHGNEISDKIGHYSAYIRDISELFAYNRGFLVPGYTGYWMTLDKFYHDQPPLPWQRNLRQNRLYLGLYCRINARLNSFAGWNVSDWNLLFENVVWCGFI